MSGKGHQPSASRRQKGKFPAYQLFSRAPQSSHALGPVPEIQIDGPSGTQSLGDIRSSGHDGSIGSHPERSLAIVPTAASSRSLGGSETSPLRRTIKWFGKWSSSNRRRPTLSHPGLSVANTRLHPAPDTSWLSHLCPEQNVGNPPSTPSIPTTIDTIPSLHSQLESIGSDPEVLGPTGPPPALAGDRKKPIIIGTTKLLLQAATFALKASPIPLLGEIPNLLLSFLQVYETVDSNNENLKGLGDEIRNAYTTILRPLQLWTGQIPPEVRAFIKEFHSALDKQTKQIQALSDQRLSKRIVSAFDITQRLNGAKACISKAVTSFSTEAAILTLLHAIQSSVRAELSRLPRAAAEHAYVTTKSECLEGTREKVQASIVKLLGKPGSRFVWLRGSPGMGKTAICLSIASYFENQGTLAASFFWDKNQPGTGLDSIQQFPSTLACQLASFHEEFKLALVKHLRQRGLEPVQNLPLEKQMRALVVEPMGDLKDLLLSSKDRFIIILDGLDECGDQRALRTLMELVLMLDALPPTFIVLVSSRPESQVVSAWDDAKDGGLDIPCEDVDKIGEETSHTVRCMVEEGLQDCVKKSVWKPSGKDFDTFASACRGLPVMASIRIRDICDQTQRGSTLRSEFEYFRDLTDAPLDLKSEYLRILRRAYMSNQSSIRRHVIDNYHQVIGMMIAAYQPLSFGSMSQLLGVPEDEIRATLNPISSIVAFSQRESLSHDGPLSPTFYHATMKESLTDHPIGCKSDRPFFVSDSKGYFLGLSLLRLVNNVIEHNEPKIHPLGDSEKWKGVKIKEQPEHVRYAFRYLFCHLDPSKLSSQNPNELWSKFDILLKRNLLSFIALSGVDFELPNESLDHNSTELLKEAKRVRDFLTENELNSSPWHIYRSVLPFTPPSSPLFKLYGHLSDPVQIFSITGEFSGYSIPLSENTLNARKVMEAELPRLLKKADRSRTINPLTDPDETDGIDHRAAFLVPNIRNGIVAAAALSRDGRYVALGFGNGVIEVADIDHHQTTSQFQCDPPNPPAWIEFICGSHRIATEDNKGNITVFSHGSPSVKVGTLPSGHHPPITMVADNGSFIIRVPRNIDFRWYENMVILSVSDEPSIHPLSSPRSVTPTFTSATPDRHTLGLSPEGRYVIVHDGSNIAIWSTEMRELVRFHVLGFTLPISYTTSPRPHLITTAGATIHSHPEYDIPQVQSLMAGHDTDLLWLERLSRGPSSNLSPSLDDIPDMCEDTTQTIWLNGKLELLLPPEYHPIILDGHQINSQEAWYGDRMLGGYNFLYLPCASKDGTRFLVQGHLQAPIVVDISQVV